MAALRVLEFIRDPDAVWNLPAAALERLAREFPDVAFDSPPDRAGLDRALPGADIVLGWAVDADNFGRAKRLRWIQVTAAGVGSLLFPALVESDVVVTNGRGIHAVAMAEHTLGVILAFVRKLHLARDEQMRRRWTQKELCTGRPEFGELAGRTLGLVGLGKVGEAIAARARALGLRVIAVRRHPRPEPAPADEQWGPDRLSDLLAIADFLVLVVPLTAGTRGLIGREQLARMKSSAILINLGRGKLVDEEALLEVLGAGRIGGAALDVFGEEPLPAESPLWGMPHVIVTPHVSGIGPRYWERAMDLFARNLRAFRAGEPLVNVVDKRAGY
jgi:phosphoglycerate dehydrogenase-like enzyme